MKLTTLDISEEIVLLVGKIIGMVKKGVFNISLLSHDNHDEFNDMILFHARRF